MPGPLQAYRPPGLQAYRPTGLQEGVDFDGLRAAWADTDRGDGGAGHLLQRLHIRLGVLGEVGEGLRPGDVLAPARECLVNRLGVVEVGLAVRQVLDPLTVDLVRDTDGDLL